MDILWFTSPLLVNICVASNLLLLQMVLQWISLYKIHVTSVQVHLQDEFTKHNCCALFLSYKLNHSLQGIKTSLGQDDGIRRTTSMLIQDRKTILMALAKVGKEVDQFSATTNPFLKGYRYLLVWGHLESKSLKMAWVPFLCIFCLYFPEIDMTSGKMSTLNYSKCFMIPIDSQRFGRSKRGEVVIKKDVWRKGIQINTSV